MAGKQCREMNECADECAHNGHNGATKTRISISPSRSLAHKRAREYIRGRDGRRVRHNAPLIGLSRFVSSENPGADFRSGRLNYARNRERAFALTRLGAALMNQC